LQHFNLVHRLQAVIAARRTEKIAQHRKHFR